MLLPSSGGHAIFHVTDFAFESNEVNVTNVMCAAPHTTNLRRVYKNMFKQTGNLTTFSQVKKRQFLGK